MKLSDMNPNLLIESVQLSESQGANQLIGKILDSLPSDQYVLIGGHTIGIYTGAPRATRDLDVVSNNWKNLIDRVLEIVPGAAVEKSAGSVRILDNGDEILDIIIPSGNNTFYRNVFKHNQPAAYLGQNINIPTVEMMLAIKFAAMISAYRETHKIYQDASDFIHIVKTNPNIDQNLLFKLGEQVYNGGGQEVLDKYNAAKNNLKFNV